MILLQNINTDYFLIATTSFGQNIICGQHEQCILKCNLEEGMRLL